MRLKLPRKENLAKTNPEDCVEYHYHLLGAPFYRNRFKMILKLMGGERFERFLDVGSASGLFFPELACRTRHLFGMDIHPNQSMVAGMCRKEGIKVSLLRAEAPHLPFHDNIFDGLLCLSCLKYIDRRGLGRVLKEMSRCTKPEGHIYLGESVDSPIRNVAFKFLRYKGYRSAYLSNHREIIGAIRTVFSVEEIRTMPPFLPLPLSLFFCVRCHNLK